MKAEICLHSPGCPHLAEQASQGFSEEESRFLPIRITLEADLALSLNWDRRQAEGSPRAFSSCDSWLQSP